MPGFTDEERDRIREQLIQNGRELLLVYGPQKTTVKDITDPVGIAKPTFYQFFDSKSDLYLVIFQREVEEFIGTVHSELADIEDPREKLERLFWCYVEFGEENQFIQQTFIKSDYQKIIGNASPGQFAAIEQKEMEALVPHLEDIKQQSDGPISEMDPVTVIGLMGSSLGWLLLHKDEYTKYEDNFESIEEGYYKRMQTVLISTLARGLTVADP